MVRGMSADRRRASILRDSEGAASDDGEPAERAP